MGLGPTSSAAVHRMQVWTLQKSSNPSLATGKGDQAAEGGSDSTQEVTSDATMVVQETWFILLLGGILLAILFLLVAALIVRRQLAKKKALTALSKSNPMDEHATIGGTVRGRDVFWSRGWSTGGKEVEVDAQATLLPHLTTAAPNHRSVAPPPEYAELLGHCNSNDQGQLSLSSFLPRRMITTQPHPAAYATTTLVTQRSVIPNPFMGSGPGASGSTFSSTMHPNSTSDSSGYTTDELGDRYRRGFPTLGDGQRERGTKSGNHKSRQGGSNNNVKLPNLGELLPPPPRHPPPASPALGIDRHPSSSSEVHTRQLNNNSNCSVN